MIYEIALHGFALLARLLFFLFGFLALKSLISKQGHGSLAAIVLSLMAAGTLFASSLASTNGRDIAVLAGTFVLLCACTLAAQRACAVHGGNTALIVPTVILVSIGTAIACDTGNAFGAASGEKFFIGILVGTVAAIGFAALLSRKGMECLHRFSTHLFALSFLLLFLPFVPFLGVTVNGGTNWIGLGGQTVQPSEFAKITFLLGLAGFCSTNKTRLSEWNRRALLPLGLALAYSLLVLFTQRDLGGALIIMATATLIITASSGKSSAAYLAWIVLGAGVVAFIAVHFPHVQTRVSAWLHPHSDPLNTGYQFLSAMSAIANGGVIGTGLGFGKEFVNVPVIDSDYVVCAAFEELGVIGFALIVASYATMTLCTVKLAGRFETGSVERNVGIGLGGLIAIEAFANLGGVLGLIPMTGLALPFVSSGGSSMVSSLAAIGLLLALASSSKKAPTAVLAKKAVPARGLAILFAALCVVLAFGCIAQIREGGILLIGTTDRDTVRGSVMTSDGVVLARNVKPEEVETASAKEGARIYPERTLASHIVGAADGIPGFEVAEEIDAKLRGASSYGAFEPFANALALPFHGSDAKLTIDSETQKTAERLLEGESGAMAAIDPQTGRILALASSDPIDPNDLAGGGSYLNRATQSVLAPGSTFKLVTLSTALASGKAFESKRYDAPSSLQLDQGAISNSGNVDAGAVTLAEATNLSLNTVFGQLGIALGSDALQAGAEQYGFNSPLPCDLPLATSTFAGSKMSEWETAWAAAGQPVTEKGPNASVLQMALVMSAIANDGTLMKPLILESSSPEVVAEATSPDTAQRIIGILSEGDTETTSKCTMLGKTGTAEKANGADDAWYIGMATGDNGRKVVVACLIEEGGFGEESAMPRAWKLAEEALVH